MIIDNLPNLTKQTVNYLVMRLDSKLIYSKQIEQVITKTANITSQLSTLMAKVGGHLPSSRIIHTSSIWVQHLYSVSRDSEKSEEIVAGTENSSPTDDINIPLGMHRSCRNNG